MNVFSSLLFLFALVRTILIYLSTRITDYLLFFSSLLALAFNSLSRAFFGYGSFPDAISGMLLFNIMSILLFRIESLKLHRRHILFLICTDAIFGLTLILEATIGLVIFTLLRRFEFNLLLLIVHCLSTSSSSTQNTSLPSVNKSRRNCTSGGCSWFFSWLWQF